MDAKKVPPAGSKMGATDEVLEWFSSIIGHHDVGGEINLWIGSRNRKAVGVI